MIRLNCPVCEHKIELADSVKDGKRITCPNCFAQLGLFKTKKQIILGCAVCKEPVFDPSLCGECERHREKKRAILEKGEL